MKKFAIIFFILFIFILSGCNNVNSNNPEVTKKEAKQIVLKEHTKEIGQVEIKSVNVKSNKYVIEWENEENCEEGTDSGNNKTGEIKMIEASIC